MVNLLKFKPKAEHADGSDPDISRFDAIGVMAAKSATNMLANRHLETPHPHRV